MQLIRHRHPTKSGCSTQELRLPRMTSPKAILGPRPLCARLASRSSSKRWPWCAKRGSLFLLATDLTRLQELQCGVSQRLCASSERVWVSPSVEDRDDDDEIWVGSVVHGVGESSYEHTT